MNGYMGKLLIIDLTNEQVEERELDREIIEKYVGGKGLGTRLYWEMIGPETDPLGSENVLMFLTGPLTGTLAPATRSCVVTKSPLTGTWLDSYVGGYFGQEIKYAGYDGLIIKGKAAKNTYVYIEDKEVKFKDATHLQNKKIPETTESIRQELENEDIKIAAIGPAGENLVKYALITCDFNRQAGRGGAGAVMGAKNLKAIAVTGSDLISVKDKDNFLAAVSQAYDDLEESSEITALSRFGTTTAISFAQQIGTLPTKNYYKGQYEAADEIATESQRETLWFRHKACHSCPVACSKVGRIFRGKFKGVTSDIVEYESAAMLGSNLEISDMKAITKIARLCDELGLDTISVGGSISYALEAAEKGCLPTEVDEERLEFGNSDVVINLIEKIASREGYLGDLLAEGVKEASAKLEDTEDFAIHIKGLETPAWPPRGAPGMGLALMTADRGGCHQRAFPISYETTELEWQGEKVPRLTVKNKAEIVVELQNNSAALDTFIKCDLASAGISEETYLSLLNSLTGLGYDVKDLQLLGKRVWNMTRLINVQDGITREEDYLPKRFVEEPLPDGPAQGHKITVEDMDTMLDEYYSLRGWDENGIPKEATLRKLDIGEYSNIE